MCDELEAGASRRCQRRRAVRLPRRLHRSRGQARAAHHPQVRRRLRLRHHRPRDHQATASTTRGHRILYVIGAPQALHLNMVWDTARRPAGSPTTSSPVHVQIGNVLGEDRKILRTRSGAPLRLMTLLDEAVGKARAVIDEARPDLDERARDDRPAGRHRRREVRRPVGRARQRVRLRPRPHGRARRATPAPTCSTRRPHPLDLPQGGARPHAARRRPVGSRSERALALHAAGLRRRRRGGRRRPTSRTGSVATCSSWRRPSQLLRDVPRAQGRRGRPPFAAHALRARRASTTASACSGSRRPSRW